MKVRHEVIIGLDPFLVRYLELFLMSVLSDKLAALAAATDGLSVTTAKVKESLAAGLATPEELAALDAQTARLVALKADLDGVIAPPVAPAPVAPAPAPVAPAPAPQPVAPAAPGVPGGFPL